MINKEAREIMLFDPNPGLATVVGYELKLRKAARDLDARYQLVASRDRNPPLPDYSPYVEEVLVKDRNARQDSLEAHDPFLEYSAETFGVVRQKVLFGRGMSATALTVRPLPRLEASCNGTDIYLCKNRLLQRPEVVIQENGRILVEAKEVINGKMVEFDLKGFLEGATRVVKIEINFDYSMA